MIVKEFDLNVKKGEFVSIIGHSGCGKSTVLSMVAGLNEITSGAIILAGKELVGPGPDRGIVFQAPCLLPWLTAFENVMLGVNQVFYTADKLERRAIAEYYLSLVGLGESMHKRPSELSGGMRQRVGIARAFALSPKMLLLDEPFAGVDPIAVIEIQRIVRFLKERGIGVLITDHSVRETLGICDRAYIINQGAVLASGSPEEIIGNESVRRVYLGENFRM